jgi:LysM repeat protein
MNATKISTALLMALVIFSLLAGPALAEAPDRTGVSGLEDDAVLPRSTGRAGYVVQRGDALVRLALRHGLSVKELAAANGLEPNALLYVGQQLHISQVPDPLPELPLLVAERPASVTPYTYARVVEDDAAVYADPSEASLGLPPKRTLGTGYVWVSVQGQTSYAGEDFYEINTGEYVRAGALSFYTPSAFHGVALAANPERSFAWILKPVQPSLTPAGEVNAEAPVYQRYEMVQIFATEYPGDQVWYLIGQDQWINQIYVGKVTLSAPPEGVAPEEAWIDVNLFEQTLAAYVGDRMVYATLVSTGLPGWNTPTGLNRVWLRVTAGKMSGADGRPDYYFLEDVPWTMYFNKDVALHTAYWHDGFGYKHSHGCVNLAPLDARWLFEWAPENVWVNVRAN